MEEDKVMRTILCYGDSNTYGYNPKDGSRYSQEVRWTGVLSNLLKDDNTRIIEEGLVGRTTVFEDSIRPGRKGVDFVVPILESHEPVDKLVLMLGTNDCKKIYNASATVVGLGIQRIIKSVRQQHPELDILLISPIHLGEDVWREEYDPEFGRESIETSKQLKEEYHKIADKYNCKFLAASDIASPSVIDQEHLNEEGHLALAKAIYEYVK